MAIEDWIDFEIDEDPAEPACRYCGKTILWIKGGNRKWVPYDYYASDMREPHRCKARVASAREFPKLED